ncbi:hypothetical protein ACH3XX_20145 [Streptomyces scabiei]|uniref:hypothetical protein n=1 Tax=Streptomyces scabiei TaxID=1930 RepID=UPI0037B17525
MNENPDRVDDTDPWATARAQADRDGAADDATARFRAADTAHTAALADVAVLRAQLIAARATAARTEAELCAAASDVIETHAATLTMADLDRLA